jgi:hypothetical protein
MRQDVTKKSSFRRRRRWQEEEGDNDLTTKTRKTGDESNENMFDQVLIACQ